MLLRILSKKLSTYTHYPFFFSNHQCCKTLPADKGILLFRFFLFFFFFFNFQTAKCGKLLDEEQSAIRISKSTIKGTSYKEPWGIPLVGSNYSWCPKESDANRTLQIEFGKITCLGDRWVGGVEMNFNSIHTVVLWFCDQAGCHLLYKSHVNETNEG